MNPRGAADRAGGNTRAAGPCAALQGLAAPAGAPASLSRALPGSHLLTTAAPRSCPTLRVPFLIVGFVQTQLEPLDTAAIIQVINNCANEFHYARLAAQSAPGQPGPTSICLGAWVSSPSAGRCQHTNLLPFTVFFVLFTEKLLMKGWRRRENRVPPTTKPPLLMLSGFLPATQAPGLSLQQGRTFLAGPFLAKPAENQVLQEGKKCDPHRSMVPKRTPLGCRALCNNSRDRFLSEYVLLTGMADDRFSSPTQTKDPATDL